MREPGELKVASKIRETCMGKNSPRESELLIIQRKESLILDQ